MASPNINYDRAAAALVDALVLGDRKAAAAHRLSVKTIGRYRARLQVDAQLSEAVRVLRDRVLTPKKPAIEDAIETCLAWLREAVPTLEPTAANIRAVTNSFQTLAEIQLANQMIEVKLQRLGKTP